MLVLVILSLLQLNSESKKSIEDALAQLKQFQVSFVQETYSDFFDPTTARGVLEISRPGKMKMAYLQGDHILRIWDGNTVFERDLLAASETRQPQREMTEEPMVRLLLYGENIDAIFSMERDPEKGPRAFRFHPRHSDDFVVEMVFDQQWLPTSLEVIGEDGDGTRFTFSEFNLQPQFTEETFRIPKKPKPKNP